MHQNSFGRGSAPDPAGRAYDAPPEPIVGWGGGSPLPIFLLSTPSDSQSGRLWRFASYPPLPIQIPGYATTHYAPPVKNSGYATVDIA